MVKPGRSAFWALAALLMVPGCGENDRTPPTSPASVITSIQIVPATDNLKVGESVTYSVAASYSGRPPTGPPPGWSSTDPAVAAVDTVGKLTGVSQGDTTIRVVFFGHTATRLVRVLP